VKDHEFSQEVDLTSLVTAKDEQSSQILELLAEKQALDDSVNFLEAYLSADKLPFEQFMKLMRRTEEDRFTCRALLKRSVKLRK